MLKSAGESSRSRRSISEQTDQFDKSGNKLLVLRGVAAEAESLLQSFNGNN